MAESSITSNDPEAFVALYAANERQLRAFLYTLLPGAAEADEVMQEVSLVLWKKFSQFDPETEFLKWAYVVARYEVLLFRRKKARDRHIFQEDLLLTLAEEFEEKSEPLERERHALEACLKKLSAANHQLLLTCYAKDMKINDMAHRLGQSPTSLYKKLNRLRQTLLACIDRATKKQHA